MQHSAKGSKTLALLGLAALVVALTTGTIAAFEPPGVDELRDRLARRQAAIAADPPRGEVLQLTSQQEPTGPAVAIFGVIEALQELQATGDFRPAQLRHLARAQEAATSAFESYGVSPDVGPIFLSLGEAALNLQTAVTPRHPLHARLAELSRRLASAAEEMASKLGDRARLAGVEGLRLRVIQGLLQGGERSLQAQNYVVAIAQFGGAGSFAANVMHFDIDLFEQNIRDFVEGDVVGFAYAIGLNGNLYVNGIPDAGGFARTAADDETPQSPTKEMYIASISKTISAVATLIALQEAGIPVTAAIAPYLPSSWTQGPNVDDITFEHLMSHQSGLDESGNQTMDELETAIANGTTGILDFADAEYTNTNFSLLRILIPQIVIGEEVIEVYVGALGEDQRAFIYAELYADYVAAEVLSPAGINAPSCAPREGTGTRTLYYLFGAPANQGGLDLGDWGLRCGSTGYYLSAVELGSLLAHMRYTDDIIDDSIRDLMNNEYLGWLNPFVYAPYVDSEVVEGDWGIYRAHGGDSSNSNTVRGMTSCMMNYPIEVEAVLLVNSRGNAVGHPCGVLLSAYDNAWVAN